jgi:hypothetical protein
VASLRDESSTRIDDSRVAGKVGPGNDRCRERLHESTLLFFESAWIEATVGIKREDGKRASNDAHRLSVHQLDNHVGHAYSLTC